MPGRGRGRGIHKNIMIPEISQEQKVLLESNKVEVEEGQFNDPVDSELNNSSGQEFVPVESLPVKSTPVESSPVKSTPVESTPVQSSNSTTEIFSNSEDADITPPAGNKSSLNVSAPEFVPRALEVESSNGPSLEQPLYYENDNIFLTNTAILEGFNCKSPHDTPLLMTAATMLIEASFHPASFDTHMEILVHMIERTPPTPEILEDLAEMLITWGISDPNLRYTAILMNDYLCKLSIKDVFRGKLFSKLQERYLDITRGSQDEEGYVLYLIDFTLFIAEMFYRVRINDKAVWILGSAVIQLVFVLLTMKTNKTVVKACNVLKLVGYTLENNTPKNNSFDPANKLETAITTLRTLSVDDDLSKHTSDVVMSVLMLQGRNWGVGLTPAEKKTMTVDAPVKKVEEWEEFVDEAGNVIEGTDYFEPTVCLDDQDDPNIDDDMMKEYEDFVNDFEEHLMLQEFGQEF